MDSSSWEGLDDWLTRFDGFTQDALAGLVTDGLAHYDFARNSWILHNGGEPFEIRNVDAAPHRPADTGGRLPGAADIDRAITRFGRGDPPDGEWDETVYRALRDVGPDQDPARPGPDRLLEEIAAAAPGDRYEISYAAGDHPGRPVTAYDEEAAIDTARRMSRAGDAVIVEHVTSAGSRRLIGRFTHITAGPQGPGPARAAAGPAGQPVPPLADRPVPGPQVPPGTTPLPVPAASSGPIRPARLLYPDGQPLDCRPVGRTGPVWAGTAAGAMPASGDRAPGWLQVVSLADGTVTALHPALVSPRDVDPYAWLPYRAQRRFSEFDTAEAAGHTAAWLPAMLVDDGDLIRTRTGEIREVRLRTWDSESAIRITTAGPGDTSTQLAGRDDFIEVMIPARHPAENTPHAARLFASQARTLDAPPETEIAGLRQAMTGLRAQHAAGPRHAGPGSPDLAVPQARRGNRSAGAAPAQPGWHVLAGMATAMQHHQDQAAASIPRLPASQTWRRLRALTADARKVATDARAGRLRFTDPAFAFRAWRAVWARACELTCDLAARVMDGLRRGGKPWQAARALHHAAAEGIAHARRWLPRDMRLPAGSYEPPGGRRISGAPGWAKADAAALLHQAGAGPLSELDFPGPLAGITTRRQVGPRELRHAARPAARQNRAGARATPPGRT